MRAWKVPCVHLMLLSMTLQVIPPRQAAADHLLGRVARLIKEKEYCGTEPAGCADGAIEYLAENIDWLEHHIDTYGSIVAKQPDIWGEARLTSHREEYEQEMFKELNQFQVKINAVIEQSDSSFIAQSLALANAAAGAPTLPATTDATLKPAEAVAVSTACVDGANKIQLEPVLELDQQSRYLQHLQELRRINEGDDTSDSPGYSLNLVRVPVSILPGKLTREGFGAEITISAQPVLSEDLLPTTFRNLVTNDLVDQLGLPIVRLTELGERLKKDHAYRVLQTKRRELQHLAIELSRLAPEIQAGRMTDADLAVKLRPFHDNGNWTTLVNKIVAHSQQNAEIQAYCQRVFRDRYHPHELNVRDAANNVAATILKNAMELNFLGALIEAELQELDVKMKKAEDEDATILVSNYVTPTPVATGRSRLARSAVPPSQTAAVFGGKELNLIAFEFQSTYSGRQVRWNGENGCETTKCDVDLLDAQKWLHAETSAAFEFLVQPAHLLLWHRLASNRSGLAEAIRSEHMNLKQFGNHSVENYRDWFFYILHHEDDQQTLYEFLQRSDLPLAPHRDEAATPIEALAWAVICESALLNKRLNEDVRKVAVAKQCYELQSDHEYNFFLPDAVLRPVPAPTEEAGQFGDQEHDGAAHAHGESGHAVAASHLIASLQPEYQEAAQIFMKYVQCRWPIHVFALDPREQDQDVADASARKRELQFALSLAFVTGEIGARSLTQYSRDLQTNVETISLNRTAAGFAHGPDTFGWRFYPRVQALDVPVQISTRRQPSAERSANGNVRATATADCRIAKGSGIKKRVRTH